MLLTAEPHSQESAGLVALSMDTSKKTDSEQIITITGETQRSPERSKVTQLEATWAVFTLKSAFFPSPYFFRDAPSFLSLVIVKQKTRDGR